MCWAKHEAFTLHPSLGEGEQAPGTEFTGTSGISIMAFIRDLAKQGCEVHRSPEIILFRKATEGAFQVRADAARVVYVSLAVGFFPGGPCGHAVCLFKCVSKTSTRAQLPSGKAR